MGIYKKFNQRDQYAQLEGTSIEAMEELFFGTKKSRRKGNVARKEQQLCHQVARALSYALSMSNEPILRSVILSHVEPAPDASRLLVYVSFSAEEFDPAEVVATLRKAKGYLRAEIAQATHRKRVPELDFAPTFVDRGER